MITKRQQRGFILAIRAGEIMMKSGGEIYRVEEIITRICRACDIAHVEVFATPTGIFASIGSGGEEGDIKTYIKAIKARTTDLTKISEINNLSRKFVSGDIDVEDAIKKAEAIDAKKPYPLPVISIGAALTASIFCGLFGGGVTDCIAAAILGIMAYLLSFLLAKYGINYYITDFVCVALASFLALVSEAFRITTGHDFIIIGVLMLFVPGAALTNALRDFLTGDMLSGVSRLTEAVAIAVSLAAGAGIILTLWNSIGGVFS